MTTDSLPQSHVQPERVSILPAYVLTIVHKEPAIIEADTQPAVEVIAKTGAKVGREFRTVVGRRNALVDSEHTDTCCGIRPQVVVHRSARRSHDVRIHMLTAD